MSYKRTVPQNVAELGAYLKRIHDNKSHVKKVEVNLNSSQLEVTLDGMAHFAGTPDVYLPVKRSKVQQAKHLVEKMLRESDQGFSPSDAEAQQLFDMIDPTAQ